MPVYMQALKEPYRDRKKVKNITHGGNLPLDEIVKIAQTMRFKSQARKLEGTVREVLGTCFSVGCTVNGQHPSDIIASIKDGSIVIDEDGNIEVNEE
jgi:large subunit ribosomal protein L12e